MKTHILLILFFLFSISETVFSQYSPKPFYSPYAKEATLAFNFSVYLTSTQRQNQPSQADITEAIEKQITFLFGALSNQTRKAVPKVEHRFQVLQVKKVAEKIWQADYAYEGQILIANGPDTYSFYLPVNPATVYQRSIPQGTSNYFPCTDQRLYMEKYFWYFFNPKAYGCPLVEGQDYVLVAGQLKPQENTRLTYPEYERLVQNGEISLDVIFGMDNSQQSWNPLQSRDINAENYRQVRQTLLKSGYQSRPWTKEELSQFFGNVGALPYVEELVKNSPRGLIKARFFFGPSTIYDGIGFQRFFVNSLNSTSVIIYAGHSGLGEYLSLNNLSHYGQFVISMPKDKYQILFFNSCSSYPYYNTEYFNLKRSNLDPKGTRNLDIITNGLSTLFLAIPNSSLSLIRGVDTWATSGRKMSYQDLMKEADSRNLIGINGDEDNL